MNIFITFFTKLGQSLLITNRRQLLPVIGSLISLILFGAVAYSLIEGWTFLDALYASVITITTVGYGDLSPQTPFGRIFAIGFTLFAISLGGYAISTFAVYFVETRQRRLAELHRRHLMRKIDSLNQHYILCGADMIGTRIAEEFTIHGKDFVVIDHDEERLKTTLLFSHPEYFQKKIQTIIDFDNTDLSAFEDLSLPEISEKVNIPYILASPTDDVALLQSGIDRAVGLIAALPDERDNLSVVIGARSLAERAGNDKMRIMAHVTDPQMMRKMYLAGANFVRIPSIMSGMEMATHIMYPEIGNWWYSNVGEMRTHNGMLQQVDIHTGHKWLGKTVTTIHQSDHTVIISIKRNDEFISPPPHDLIIQPDDIAIVVQ